MLLDGEIGLLLYLLPFSLDIPMRSQVVRSLALRSQLAIERNYTGAPTPAADANGSWRVVINWLVVGPEQKDDWLDQITEMRRETSFSEEVGLDAIFFENGDVERDVECYGFPDLLLTTREVLRKPQLEDMEAWLSADGLVKRAIKKFTGNFSVAEQRRFASKVERALERFPRKSPSEMLRRDVSSAAEPLRSVRVTNFRNLGDVKLDFGADPVSALVVHGPNGTGKSSLCEALSIGLFGSSYRYKQFADRVHERDVRATDRASNHIARYLSPLDSETGGPKISLNDRPATTPSLVDGDETEDSDLLMSGTILTQDTTIEFARMPSDALNARVLRGYSALADYIEEFVETQVAQAEAARSNLLHKFGLTAAIKKLDTALERIAKRELDRSLPPLPVNLVGWVERLDHSHFATPAADLVTRWRATAGENATSDLPRAIARASGKRVEIERLLGGWLQNYNELAAVTVRFLTTVQDRVRPLEPDFDKTAARVRAWEIG